MNTTTILYILLALLSTILLVVLMTPKETRVEYVKEVPYPNYFAIWPSPYYRDWTGESTPSWRPKPHSGRRVSYGAGYGYSSGGSHGGGKH